jgi:hypothetical protein
MIAKILLATLLVCFVFPASAMAYIDPGSGSLLYQFLIAAFLGFAITVRIYWGKVKTILVRLISKGSDASDQRFTDNEQKH